MLKHLREVRHQDKIILHLCADTGSDSHPYCEAGYDVILVGKDIGVENFYPQGFANAFYAVNK